LDENREGPLSYSSVQTVLFLSFNSPTNIIHRKHGASVL
jgi:hypothetical protein